MPSTFKKKPLSGEDVSLLALLALYSGASKQSKQHTLSALKRRDAKQIAKFLGKNQPTARKTKSKAAVAAQNLKKWAQESRRTAETLRMTAASSSGSGLSHEVALHK